VVCLLFSGNFLFISVTTLFISVTDLSIAVSILSITVTDLSIAVADIKAKWTETREKMKVMLIRLSEEQLNAPLYKNYAVGYISIPEQLKFLLIHLQRHIKQIDKTFKKMKDEN
jgi:hypothetical protein